MINLLEKHAKSFYWASFFLSKQTFNKCSSLYNFCRTLDDIVDDDKKLDIKKEKFIKFKKNFAKRDLSNRIIKEMWAIIESENISKKVVNDLFDGVETDLKEKVEINSKGIKTSGFSFLNAFNSLIIGIICFDFVHATGLNNIINWTL